MTADDMTWCSTTIGWNGRIEPTGPASSWCQRWGNGRHSWQHTSQGGFDRHRYETAPIEEHLAKSFVTTHHYSGTYPAARMSWGMFDNRRNDELVGVAVLSVPMQERTLTNVFPDLVPYEEALELGRFVLLDDVPGNGESWFLARIFRSAGEAGVRGVVSFADPAPRIVSGTTVMPGHVGTIYQSVQAVYCGRATPRTLRFLPDGTVLSDRTIAKIRNGERGRRYATDMLVHHGARPPRCGEDLATWLKDALDAVTVAGRHHGNHRYAFPLGTNRRERAGVRIALNVSRYPKTIDEPLLVT